MRKLTLVGVALSTITLAIPATAAAGGGPPADTHTEIIHGTDVTPFAGPCGGGPGMATTVFHDVFHITAFENGDVLLRANQAGTFNFVPNDPDELAVSGRYRTGFTTRFTQNTGSDTSVFTVVGRNADGERVRFQVRSHFTFANGELRVDHSTLSCP
jgi:hypothetical protein